MSETASEIPKKRHPQWTAMNQKWLDWRVIFEASDDFIESELVRVSERESATDFKERKDLAYAPAFGTAAIVEIRNAIYQNFPHIMRKTPSETYNRAVLGLDGGVDLKSTTMNSFMGNEVLTDLLSLGKIGVFVDMPSIEGTSIAEQVGARPYIYTYRPENILSWATKVVDGKAVFTSLLLKHPVDNIDPESDLVTSTSQNYRFFRLLDSGGVQFQEFNASYEPVGVAKMLQLPTIPFVVVELPMALMQLVARYQVALLQLASSDVMYSIKSNFPFYTEQYNQHQVSEYVRAAAPDGSGTAAEASAQKTTGATNEIRVGPTKGRRYPKDTDRPGFIHPSPEPMEVAMSKEEQLKREIRELVQLGVTSYATKMASAESKDRDSFGLQSGLCFVGLQLQRCEQAILQFWLTYESKDLTDASIVYPSSYSTDSDNQIEAKVKELREDIDRIPSISFKRAAAKRIVRLRMNGKMTDSEINAIEKEIDNANVIVSEPKLINLDVEAGVLSASYAAELRGYPADCVEQAQEEHASRLARIQAAQATQPARGVGDMNADGKIDKEADRQSDMRGETGKQQRGEGK